MLGTLVLLAGVARAQFGYSQDELDLFDLVEEVGVQETLYVIYQYTIEYTVNFKYLVRCSLQVLRSTPKIFENNLACKSSIFGAP